MPATTKLEGSAGTDVLDGGAGLDQLYGNVGSCTYSCTFESDTLLARDGERDTVDCGGGADTAIVDFVDVVASCASVDRAAEQRGLAPLPPPPPVPVARTARLVAGFTTASCEWAAKG